MPAERNGLLARICLPDGTIRVVLGEFARRRVHLALTVWPAARVGESGALRVGALRVGVVRVGVLRVGVLRVGVVRVGVLRGSRSGRVCGFGRRAETRVGSRAAGSGWHVGRTDLLGWSAVGVAWHLPVHILRVADSPRREHARPEPEFSRPGRSGR